MVRMDFTSKWGIEVHLRLQDASGGAIMVILHAMELIVWEMHDRPS
jgi:hypothetical protein